MVLRYMGTRYPVEHFRREMERLLSGFFGRAADGGWPFAGRGQPPVNVWQTPEAVCVELEIPGEKSDQVDVAVVGNELSIKVERPEGEQEGVTYHRRERGTGSFNRVLPLPDEVDGDRVEAELRHGVLTVTLPKAESARPRKIQVTSGK